MNICHLLNFNLQFDGVVSLNDKFEIRKLSIEEVEHIRYTDIYFNALSIEYDFFDWEDFHYCIDYSNATSAELEKVIVAMNLFSGSSVSRGVHIDYTINCEGELAEEATYLNAHRNLHGNGVWEANEEEIVRFKKYWNSINNKYLDLSELWLRYFMEALASKREDCLIKLTIALENILLRGESDSKAYNFANRASQIIRNRFEQNRNIFGKFRVIYTLRSKIVHGEKVDISPETINEYLCYCRLLFSIYLENKSGWNNSMKLIDSGKIKLCQNFVALIMR